MGTPSLGWILLLAVLFSAPWFLAAAWVWLRSGRPPVRPRSGGTDWRHWHAR